jgi:hypothetical protein
MPFKNKLAVTLAFACRLPVIPTAIIRVVNLNNKSGSLDYTWDIVLPVVLEQVEMHFSLIAATIPCLRPFLSVWNTGYLATQAGQVDRSIVDPATESSYALRSKNSTNESHRNSYNRNSLRNSQMSSYQTKTTAGPYVPSVGSHMIEDSEEPPSPPQLPRKWKSPEELPTLTPYTLPAIMSTNHPRQLRVGSPESVQKASRSLNLAAMNSSDEDNISISNQGTEKWIIQKTVGYEVTRSLSFSNRSD